MSEMINGRRVSLRNKSKLQQMQMSSSSVRLADRYDGGSMAAPSKPAPVVIVKKKTKKKQKKTNKGVDEKKMTVVNKEGNVGNVEVKTPRGRVSFGKMEVVQVLSPESDESMGGEPSPAQNNNKENNSCMDFEAIQPCSHRKSFASSVGVESNLSFEFAETQQDAPEFHFNIIE